MTPSEAKKMYCWRTYDAQDGRQSTRKCLADECMGCACPPGRQTSCPDLSCPWKPR